MTREEFEALRNRVKTSGETLKSVLKAEGIAYSTYNYWLRKTRAEREPHPIAPITIREAQRDTPENMLAMFYCKITNNLRKREEKKFISIIPN